MLAPRNGISTVAAFALGVIATLTIFTIAFFIGRASAGNPGPRPTTPRVYVTFTPVVSGTPAAATALPTDTPFPPPTFTPAPAPPSSAPTQELPPPTLAPAPPTPAPVTAADAAEQAAIALVNRKGYQVIDAGHYHSGGPLQVLIGTAGPGRDWAFFFVNDHWIGTDLPDTSASMSVVGQTGNTVVIRYDLYRPADPLCCPSGGYQDVPYHWNGDHLAPLAPYPGSSPNAPLGRR
jgi:hypothetical protein